MISHPMSCCLLRHGTCGNATSDAIAVYLPPLGSTSCLGVATDELQIVASSASICQGNASLLYDRSESSRQPLQPWISATLVQLAIVLGLGLLARNAPSPRSNLCLATSRKHHKETTDATQLGEAYDLESPSNMQV